MKQALLFLISLLTYVNCTAQPAIFAAGEITYEHISDSTYTFYANLYQDCTGGKEPDTITACFNDPCDNTYSFTAKLAKTNSRGNVAQMGCSQYPTNCSEPDAIRGYRIWHYGATITLPAQCNSWHIAVMADTMTSNLSLTPAKFYVETIFNNIGGNRDNSSLFFIDDATAYCGEGIPFNFRTQPIDPDGDSLVIEVVTPRTADSLCGTSYSIPYMQATPPYSVVDNPFPTLNTFQFDKNTDTMLFKPASAGTAVIALKVYEYRAGELLGTVVRNQVIHIMQGPFGVILGDHPQIGKFYNCTYQLGNIIAHANDSFSFQVSIHSSRPNEKLMMYDDCDSSLPNAKTIYTGQYSNSVSATLTYKPTLSDTGLHYVLFKIVDTTCDSPGLLYNTWMTNSIFIDPTPSDVNSISKQGNLNLYPNPTTGQLTITGLEHIQGAIAEIINILGQIIYKEDLPADGRITLPTNATDGLYQIKILAREQMYQLKFMLKH